MASSKTIMATFRRSTSAPKSLGRVLHNTRNLSCTARGRQAMMAERVEAPASLIPTSTAPFQWSSVAHKRLSRDSFLDLVHGRIPAICEPSFLSREVCTSYQQHLNPKLAPYDHIAGPRVDKVGVAQFEFQAQSAEDFQNRRANAKDEYFAKASELSELHAQIAQAIGSPDPSASIIRQLSALFPDMDVIVAREVDGRRYHSGIYRCINNSTPIHCDFSPYDSITEDWIINRITAQCVYNLYLAPIKGGETILYDRSWTADVLQYRDPNTYGYFADAVAGCQTSTLRPQPGDLIFFNTRNLHEVKAVEDEYHAELGKWKRPRLTLSSFIGALPEGILSDRPALIFWS